MKPLLSGLLGRAGASLGETQQDTGSAQPVDLWFHASLADHLPAFLQLRRSIVAERPDLSCLVTAPPNIEPPEGFDALGFWHNLDGDKPSEVLELFDRFAPKLCLWGGGWVKPALISEAARQDIPLFLIDAQVAGIHSGRWRGFGGAEKRAFLTFASCFARNAEAASLLGRFGVAANDISITGPMQAGVPPLPHNEADLEGLRTAVGSRPAWLAACVCEGEINTVIQAHLKASQTAHRLLLILVPDKEDQTESIKQSLIDSNLRFSVWPDVEGLADETAQVLLASDPFEAGLWFRLSPVAFMGASLVAGHGGHNPYIAANLGSAILYGPNVRAHLDSYSLFASAGGARIVRDTDTLAAAVTQLSAPDRAAQMALAAWQIATEGAETTDKITDLVHDALDHLGVY